jgi:hypothetical protein
MSKIKIKVHFDSFDISTNISVDTISKGVEKWMIIKIQK